MSEQRRNLWLSGSASSRAPYIISDSLYVPPPTTRTIPIPNRLSLRNSS